MRSTRWVWLAWVGPAVALAAAGTISVEAPVTAVTVFSDAARVTRTASVSVAGTQAVELPLLDAAIDLVTLRVEASGGEVRRVEVEPVPPGEVPQDEGRKLLAEEEKLADQLTRLRNERSAYQSQAEALARVSPAAPPNEPLKPPAKLDPSGWTAATGFLVEESGKLAARGRQLDGTIRELEKQLAQAREKRRLRGNAVRRGGYRLVTTLAGAGPITLSATYVIRGARWLPTYDVRLAPDTGKVELTFAGQVSQETGEDWNDVAVTLSTAVPSSSAELPKLSAWKIGEKERFIPTPVPPMVRVPPPPRIPEPPPEAQPTDERTRDQTKGGVKDFKAPAEQYVVDGLEDESIVTGLLEKPDVTAMVPKQEPKARPPAAPMGGVGVSQKRGGSKRSFESLARSSPDDASDGDGLSSRYGSSEASETITITGSTGEASLPARGGLLPPSGYSPRQVDPKLPAAAAGGYDLSYTTARKESLRSGEGTRRMALFSETWPVSVERKVYPALYKEAFLVAELKSPSKQVLPAGEARLFVGADPAGTADLKLVSPGESLTLPLGIDAAVKPVRNVQLVQSEKGLIGKDDLTEYVVTSEIPNPYRTPIQIRVLDQWPVTGEEKVEIKLLRTEPWAIQDKVKGSLEWHLTVPPGGKATVSFTYSIRRPRNVQLWQDPSAGGSR